jgi:predicted lipoprotein with Yx(FWY)xxD motif
MGAGGVLALLAAGATAAYAHGSSSASGYGSGEPAVVALESSPYGPVLVVGGAGAGLVPGDPSGKPPTPARYIYPAGTSLYFATIDPRAPKGRFGVPYMPGCLTTVVEVMVPEPGKLSCTGLETDEHADWPAFTTAGKPIAGPGVDPHLLGSVFRSDLGTFQVTYAGHPLYLFDPGPNSFFGANFFESVLPLPPWHTAWFLLSPEGVPASGSATLKTEAPQPGTTYGSTVLGTVMLPNVPPSFGITVTVYSFSGDSHGHSHCVGACARDFIPVYTSGAPTTGAGVNGTKVGVISRHGGSHQVTYDGHPLYIYSQEQPLVGEEGPISTGSVGNGNGIHAFGGTFSGVSP